MKTNCLSLNFAAYMELTEHEPYKRSWQESQMWKVFSCCFLVTTAFGADFDSGLYRPCGAKQTSRYICFVVQYEAKSCARTQQLNTNQL